RCYPGSEPPRGVFVWRKFVLGVVAACCIAPLFAGAARATDLPPPVYKPAPVPPPPPPPVLWSTWYVGGAVNWGDHTGYVPIPRTSANSPYSAEAYTFGGKVFGGYRINPFIQIELAYHYLGEIKFFEGAQPWSHERSQAVAASAMFFSRNLSPYFPWWQPSVP